jgi:hypothetical protein
MTVWGEFSFFFVYALDIFKVWWEESFFCKKHFCSNRWKNGNLPKKKRRHDLSSPLQDLRENMKISSIRFWELFYLEFPPFFLFYQGKFVFPEQFLFICIKLKYLKFRRSPVGGKKWRLVGNWNPKGKKTKKKQKKDKSVSRSKKKRFILSFFTFFSILLSLVIFVLFKHIRAGPRFFFFCFFLLHHWRKPIINTFCAVSEPKYFFCFATWRCWKTPKKVCLCNKSC